MEVTLYYSKLWRRVFPGEQNAQGKLFVGYWWNEEQAFEVSVSVMGDFVVGYFQS